MLLCLLAKLLLSLANALDSFEKSCIHLPNFWGNFSGEHTTFERERKCFAREYKVSLGNANILWEKANVTWENKFFERECKVSWGNAKIWLENTIVLWESANVLQKITNVSRENSKFLRVRKHLAIKCKCCIREWKCFAKDPKCYMRECTVS